MMNFIGIFKNTIDFFERKVRLKKHIFDLLKLQNLNKKRRNFFLEKKLLNQRFLSKIYSHMKYEKINFFK